jgi:hypothetical protein
MATGAPTVPFWDARRGLSQQCYEGKHMSGRAAETMSCAHSVLEINIGTHCLRIHNVENQYWYCDIMFGH